MSVSQSILVFLFGCFLLVLHGEETNQPTRLTGVERSKMEGIEIRDLDQCFPPTDDDLQTFGLAFRFPSNGGHCDGGLIICYQSMHASRYVDNIHSTGIMSVHSRMFNIENIENNFVANECQRLAEADGKGANIVWHGIGIKTKRTNGLSTITLNTSFISRSFRVRDVFHQFNIHLGNKDSVAAYVTVDGEKMNVDGNKAQLYKEMASAGGAQLKDFVGFWTLSIDMMPWNEDTIKLFATRHCNCSLEAWFTRPSDSEPTDPVKPSMGSGRFEDRCDQAIQTTNMSLQNLTFDQVIVVRLVTQKMLNKGLEALSVRLLNSNNAIVFSVTFDLVVQKVTFSMDGKSKTYDFDVASSPEGDLVINLLITLKEYSYRVMVNEQLAGGKERLPKEWWKKLPLENITQLQLHGHYALLDEPRVFPPQPQDEPSREELFYSAVPRFEKSKFENSALFVRVQLLDNNTATKFNISLLHDIMEPIPDIGATVIQLEVNTDNKIKPIELSYVYKTVRSVFSSEMSKKLSAQFNETIANNHSAFQIKIWVADGGKAFVVRLNLEEEKAVTIPSVLPIWSISSIRVAGNVTFVIAPEYALKKAETDDRVGYELYEEGKAALLEQTLPEQGTKFALKLHTLLNYGDKIVVEGHIIALAASNARSSEFSIILMHESEQENNYIGDTLLTLKFRINKEDGALNKKVYCSYHLHSQTPRQTQNFAHEMSEKGGRIKIEIVASSDHFQIRLNEEEDVNACSYAWKVIRDSNGPIQNVTMPPWAVDRIRIEGEDIKVKSIRIVPNALNIIHHGHQILTIKQIDPFYGKGFLREGNVIKVNVPMDATIPLSVALYYEALGANKIIGKTVLKAQLTNINGAQQLQLTGFKSTKAQCPPSNSTVSNVQNIQFIATDTGFNVTINGNNSILACPFRTKLPIWAVQYITVYSMAPHFNLSMISCEPEQLCVGPSHHEMHSDG